MKFNGINSLKNEKSWLANDVKLGPSRVIILFFRGVIIHIDKGVTFNYNLIGPSVIYKPMIYLCICCNKRRFREKRKSNEKRDQRKLKYSNRYEQVKGKKIYI